ncbi:hypothetical protein P618_200846 [Holospora obtusa F1]|uniref:Uncharacterized protein n=1 Tax=Holospora obtusa F1 TaxID=1399147 RepID=W6TD94_HOLOB|nr:hypothetical protein P618_200846 [Holospora obtusa F1]
MRNLLGANVGTVIEDDFRDRYTDPYKAHRCLFSKFYDEHNKTKSMVILYHFLVII